MKAVTNESIQEIGMPHSHLYIFGIFLQKIIYRITKTEYKFVVVFFHQMDKGNYTIKHTS